MNHERSEEPTRVQRVFGFFVFVAAAGLAVSLVAPQRLGLRPAPASAGAADASLAYAACQASVRERVARGARLRFSDDLESFNDTDGRLRALVSRVVVEPALGGPFAQRFVCRVQRVGVGPASVWRVSRLNLDLPAS